MLKEQYYPFLDLNQEIAWGGVGAEGGGGVVGAAGSPICH